MRLRLGLVSILQILTSSGPSGFSRISVCVTLTVTHCVFLIITSGCYGIGCYDAFV